jgi:uncharacterized membrane protein YeiH
MADVSTMTTIWGAAVLEPPLWIELPAVIAGALAGGLFAQRRGLDVIGVLALALVSGLGGGLVRDVLLARVPLALQESWYLWAVAAAAVAGAFFAEAANRMRFGLLLIDAVSLALFSVVGAQGGLSAALPIPASILLGAITGVGGSVLRDVLVGEAPPRMLRRGPPYASAALFGASAYVGLVAGLDLRKFVAQVVAVTLILVVRGMAWWRGWESPEPRDLTPAVLRARHEGWGPPSAGGSSDNQYRRAPGQSSRRDDARRHASSDAQAHATGCGRPNRKEAHVSATDIEVGPIDYVVLEWPARKKPTGDALPLLIDLVDRGLIRVLDLAFVQKQEDGTILGLDIQDLGQNDPQLTVFEGADSGLLGDDDLDAASDAIEPGCSAALLVYENTWAAPFATAVRRGGAQLVATGRIPVNAVIAALDEVEGKE